MVFSHYDILLQSGWKITEIDDMDFLGYIDVLVWRVKKDIRPVTIDECPFLATGVRK